MEKFIKENRIRVTVERTDQNPAQPKWKDADHWKCKLRNAAGRSMTVYFSKGFAHKGKEPSAEELLECLQSDCAGLDHIDGNFYDDEKAFERFCGDLGYDTDSRSAERIFKSCIKQAKNLYRFLNGKFEEFMQIEQS